MTLPNNHSDRMNRARLALEGLSVADALGQTCFDQFNFEALLDDPRATAKAPWPWTDDTAMAVGIFEVLEQRGTVDQDALARRFASRWQAAPWRGYGAGAARLLSQISVGFEWRIAGTAMFGGQGSFGNGSAMRIAPLAAYFAEDGYSVVAEQAAKSAEVTHAHPEGIAGGIAAAIAGAYAWVNRDRRSDAAVKRGLFDEVLKHTPGSDVRAGIEKAAAFDFKLPEPAVRLLDHGMRTVAFDTALEPIVRALGNGSQISCQDTVPFCLWAAAKHLDDYQSAIVTTIRAGGDIDTTAAIVGGIVSLAASLDSIPADWRKGREELVI
jgi:ADP-ribosylglycohydrolase